MFRLTMSFLALVVLIGGFSSRDRSPMDRDEVVSRAVDRQTALEQRYPTSDEAAGLSSQVREAQ